MNEKEIKRILKEHKDAFDILEEYDKTGKLPKEIEEKGEEFERNERKKKGNY